MRIDYRTQGAREKINNNTISAFNVGEKTTYEADRMKFDSLQVMKNLYSNKGNAKLRRGYRKLAEILGIRGIFVYKEETNKLMGNIIDTDTTIVEIDREDGTTTDIITGIVGTNSGYFDELRGVLYYSNEETSIQIWDGTTASTISFDYGGGTQNVGLLASDESRVWGVSKELPTEVLVFSKDDGTGKITSFNTGGTAINRSGIASSKIKKFTALKSVGKTIFASGVDSVEIHSIPDFATNGITSFPANVSTLVVSYEDIGVENANACIRVGNKVYFKGNDDKLHSISSTGSLKTFTDELGLWQNVDWTECTMAYDADLELIYLTGNKVTPSDFVGVFNITDQSFSTFTDIYASMWAGDRDGLYFLSGEDIYKAFESNVYDDDGLGIEWEILTQMTYGNTKEYYKVLREIALAFQLWEDIDITLEAVVDRGITSSISASTETISEVFSIDVFSANPESFGRGVWGGANIKYTTGEGMEKFLNTIMQNKRFHRLEVRLTGKSKSPLEIKEISLKYIQTMQKVNTIKYA